MYTDPQVKGPAPTVRHLLVGQDRSQFTFEGDYPLATCWRDMRSEVTRLLRRVWARGWVRPGQCRREDPMGAEMWSTAGGRESQASLWVASGWFSGARRRVCWGQRAHRPRKQRPGGCGQC